MHISSLVGIFVAFWLSGVGGFFLLLLTQVLRANDGEAPVTILLMPLGMFIFGYGLTLGGFKAEARNSKEFLVKLFEAEIE